MGITSDIILAIAAWQGLYAIDNPQPHERITFAMLLAFGLIFHRLA